VRGTYYTDSGTYEDFDTTTTTTDSEGVSTTRTSTERRLRGGGSIFRPVVNAGVESSFKFSRAFEQVQSRMWGLDGLAPRRAAVCQRVVRLQRRGADGHLAI
jgi:hypothetical protein